MLGFLFNVAIGLALVAGGWPDAGGVVLVAGLAWLMDDDEDGDGCDL